MGLKLHRAYIKKKTVVKHVNKRSRENGTQLASCRQKEDREREMGIKLHRAFKRGQSSQIKERGYYVNKKLRDF